MLPTLQERSMFAVSLRHFLESKGVQLEPDAYLTESGCILVCKSGGELMVRSFYANVLPEGAVGLTLPDTGTAVFLAGENLEVFAMCNGPTIIPQWARYFVMEKYRHVEE